MSKSMYIYYLFIFVILIFTSLDFVQKQKIRRFSFVVLLICCILFFGGRYNCDLDYENYVQMYLDTPALISETWDNFLLYYLTSQVEIGFLLSCSILKSIGASVQSIFFWCAFLTFFFVGKAIWKLSKYPFLSLFLFLTQFFGQPFMQMRFGVAIAFVLWACYHLFGGEKKLYWIYLVLGISFHFTAIAGVVPCIFSNINWNQRRIFLLFLFSALLMVIPLQGILGWGVSLIGFDRYIWMYFDTTSNRYATIFLLGMVLLPLIIYKGRLAECITGYGLLLCMGLGSIVLAPLANSVSLFSRFYMLLSVAYCFIMPSYFFLLKKSCSNYTFMYLFILLYGLQRFSVNLSSMYPYQFRIW